MKDIIHRIIAKKQGAAAAPKAAPRQPSGGGAMANRNKKATRKLRK